MSEKREVRHLTERGGIGLVIFHLARRKIEFALTLERSPLGDIWASIGDRKISIEVKTCRDAMKWQVRKSQASRVEYYVLVAMDAAKCFVLTSGEMAKILRDAPIIYGDICLVGRDKIADLALNAWGKLDGKHSPNLSPGILGPKPIFRAAYKHTRTVRRKLADGTMKTYTYPGTDALQRIERKAIAADFAALAE